MKLFFVFFVSFVLAIMIAPKFIQSMKKKQFGQSVREEGPEHHQVKSGTPTLGGIIFIVPFVITSLLFIEMKPEIWLILYITVAGGFIGFLDDFIKLILKRNLGLTSKQKMAAQILVSLSFLYFLDRIGINTNIYIPGTEWVIPLSGFYSFLVVFMLVGTMNATNLTDGLDGLLTGTSVIAISTFAILAFYSGNENVGYLLIAIVGSLVGFLLFNVNPAKIFMGDTGSLAIGGLLAGVSIVLKLEVLLIVIGGVFVIETISVILQVLSFKWKQKRIFKMSPIHHHFELSGYNEVQVVKGFWVTGLLFSLMALSIVILI